MIVIAHGDNIKESRDYYFNEKKKSSSPVTLDGSKVSLTDLAQSVKGQELFGGGVSVFIEELLSKKKKGKDYQAILTFLKENEEESVFLWESKTLSIKETGIFTKAVVKKFDFPKEIFAFLESIKPGNERGSIVLFHRVIETQETEFVFFMMVRHFRILLGLEASPDQQIDEVKRLGPWQITKLSSQRKLFTIDGLKNFYNKLFNIEKGLKTGKLSSPLPFAIDFLLSSL